MSGKVSGGGGGVARRVRSRKLRKKNVTTRIEKFPVLNQRMTVQEFAAATRDPEIRDFVKFAEENHARIMDAVGRVRFDSHYDVSLLILVPPSQTKEQVLTHMRDMVQSALATNVWTAKDAVADLNDFLVRAGSSLDFFLLPQGVGCACIAKPSPLVPIHRRVGCFGCHIYFV